MAFSSHTAADRGAGYACLRTATSTIRTSFAVAQPNGQQSAILHISPPKRQSSVLQNISQCQCSVVYDSHTVAVGQSFGPLREGIRSHPSRISQLWVK